MDSEPTEPVPSADAVFLSFGQACRAERDRVQLARLDEEDCRFDDGFHRAVAEAFVDKLIASIGSR